MVGTKNRNPFIGTFNNCALCYQVLSTARKQSVIFNILFCRIYGWKREMRDRANVQHNVFRTLKLKPSKYTYDGTNNFRLKNDI